MKRRCLPILLLPLALAGCGGSGGGSGGSDVAPPAQTVNYGPLGLEGFATGEPVYASGYGANIIGLTGTFSAVTLTNPKPTLDQTQIAFAENRYLYVMDSDGANLRRLVGPRNSDITRISYSAGGGAIYFSDNQGLWSMPSYGGTPTLLEGDGVDASVSPDGTRILYRNASGVWVSSIAGTGDTLLPDSNTFGQIWWFDNSRFLTRIGGTNSLRNITDGTNSLLLSTEGQLGGGRFGRYYLGNAGTDFRRYTISALGWTYETIPNLTGSTMSLAALSPDGNQFVTVEGVDANQAGARYIRRRDTLGQLPLISNVWRGGLFENYLTAIAWQPFVTVRVIAGASSIYGGDAHAVVFGRSGTKPGGIALARALTPSTVRIAADDKLNNGPNITYTMEADRFLKLSFSTDKNYSLFNAPVTATTNGAFVTFTSATGDVVDIITYAVTRSQAKPTLRKEGSLRVYEGAIQGVFDATGKNLLPQGATQVKLDINGRLVSSR